MLRSLNIAILSYLIGSLTPDTLGGAPVGG